MHLDCVFSILGRDVCLMYEPMMGEASTVKRMVDEFVQDFPGGHYRLNRYGAS